MLAVSSDFLLLSSDLYCYNVQRYSRTIQGITFLHVLLVLVLLIFSLQTFNPLHKPTTTEVLGGRRHIFFIDLFDLYLSRKVALRYIIASSRESWSYNLGKI